MKNMTVDFLCERIKWDLDSGDTPKKLGLPAKAVVQVSDALNVGDFIVKEKGRNGKRFFLIDKFVKAMNEDNAFSLCDELSDRFGFCVSGIGKISVQNMDCLEDV